MSDEPIDFSKKDDEGWSDLLVREQSWPSDGPGEMEIAIEIGSVRVQLDDAGGTVRVEVRHDPAAGGGWAQGVQGLVNWVGANWMGTEGGDPGRYAADGVQDAEISWSATGRRLVVRSAPELPARLVPLAVTVVAPAGSRLAARTGAGDVTVTGRANWAALRSGSGSVKVGDVAGDLDISTGSGEITVGSVSGRGRIRTGSGGITVNDSSGPVEIKTGSGDVVLGTVAGDLGVRTGSGEIRISDAVAGRADLSTGTGNLTVAVHPGVLAEVDLSSGSGRARSDLDVSPTAPAGAQTPLQVRGRTKTGDVRVTRASIVA